MILFFVVGYVLTTNLRGNDMNQNLSKAWKLFYLSPCFFATTVISNEAIYNSDCCILSGTAAATTPSFTSNMGQAYASSYSTFTYRCSDSEMFPCKVVIEFTLKDSSQTYDTIHQEKTLPCGNSSIDTPSFVFVPVDSGKTIMAEAKLYGIDDCDPNGPISYLVSYDFKSALSP